MSKEYEICKDACANSPNCHCPEDHVFHQEVAQTKEFIRRYFFQKGWDECIKECHVSTEEALLDVIEEISINAQQVFISKESSREDLLSLIDNLLGFMREIEEKCQKEHLNEQEKKE